jgi:cytochrome c556
LDSKIILPFYNDLMWAPETEKIRNPERFALDFAPISRSYSVSYADYDFNEEIELEPYRRNENVFKYSLPKAVAMFKKWKEEQNIKDVMLFDYHLMWDHHYDPGYYKVAEILQKDMASLDKIGLDGMISCQLQRIAFPTNLPMYCMAKALWNKNETFDGIAKEYYLAAYGEYADVVEEYMSTLSKLFVPEVLRGEKPYDAKEMTEKYEQAKQVVKEFENNYILKLQDTSKLWKYLFHHAQLVKIYADVYIARFNGNEDECKAKTQEIYDYANSIRTFADTVLDDNFLRGDVYNNLFGWRKTI